MTSVDPRDALIHEMLRSLFELRRLIPFALAAGEPLRRHDAAPR